MASATDDAVRISFCETVVCDSSRDVIHGDIVSYSTEERLYRHYVIVCFVVVLSYPRRWMLLEI